MESLLLLAQQQQPEPSLLKEGWGEATRLLGPWAPAIVVPAFLVLLGLVTFAVERVLVALLRRLTARTRTTVDDAFVGALPGVLRPLVAILALHVLALVLLPEPRNHEIASKVLMALSIVVIAIALVRMLLRMVDAWTSSADHLRPLGSPIKLGVKVAAVPLIALTTLHALEVPIVTLLTALGVGSLAVALALQDVLKNMFAGIQLVLDRPIRAGDFIHVDDDVRGTVIEIGLRSTRLRNLENNTIIVPNSTIANAIVTNTDALDRTYLHTFTVGVGYGSDSRKVQSVIEDEVGRAVKELPELVDEPPTVTFREFGDSALVFGVRVRLQRFTGRRNPLGEVHHRLHERLRREGIEIPFPTRTVYLRRTEDAPPPEKSDAETGRGPPVSEAPASPSSPPA